MERPASQNHLEAFSADTTDISPQQKLHRILREVSSLYSGLNNESKCVLVWASSSVTDHVGCFRACELGHFSHIKDVLKWFPSNCVQPSKKKKSGMGIIGCRHELIYSGRYHAGYVLQVYKQISERTETWLIMSSLWSALLLHAKPKSTCLISMQPNKKITTVGYVVAQA